MMALDSFSAFAERVGGGLFKRHRPTLLPRCRKYRLIQLGTDGGQVAVKFGAVGNIQEKASSLEQGICSAEQPDCPLQSLDTLRRGFQLSRGAGHDCQSCEALDDARPVS